MTVRPFMPSDIRTALLLNEEFGRGPVSLLELLRQGHEHLQPVDSHNQHQLKRGRGRSVELAMIDARQERTSTETSELLWLEYDQTVNEA
jgi:hypothetical protein